MSLLRVALGTACGAAVRHALQAAWPVAPDAFPVTTLAVNVTGCLLIGWLAERFDSGAWSDRRGRRSFWLAGVCGGYTTFSLFAWEGVARLETGGATAVAALLYILLTIVLGLAAVGMGRRLARRPRQGERSVKTP